MLREAHVRQDDRREFHGVVFARRSSISIGQIVDQLVLVAEATLEGELINRVEYLPLK